MDWSPWRELRMHLPDVIVHHCRLSEGLAWWCPDERVILVDDRLDLREERCVLAHEIGHALLGHEGSPDFGHRDWLAQRMEVQADRWAAQRLVPLPALAEALCAHGDDVHAAALQLHVTEEVLLIRLGMLTDVESECVRQRVAAVEPAA